MSRVNTAIASPAGHREVMVREDLIPRGAVVVVAVSGGLDSIVLLDVLAQDAPEHGWRLVVAHFNHRLRGRESLADARWVQREARRYGLPFVGGVADVGRLARRNRISREMAARRARHEFLAKVARQVGADHVALAHHADDQVELFFLRALRGTAVEGLGGMASTGTSPADPAIRLQRPLLALSRRELRAYADARGLRWREDGSNSDLTIQRNRLRHKVLPLIEREFQPALSEVIPRLMESLRVEHDWVRVQADDVMQQGGPVFESLHPALQRELVHRELQRLGVVSTTGLIDRLRASPPMVVTASGGELLVRNGMRVERGARNDADGGWNEAASGALELHGRRGRIEYGGRVFDWSRTVVQRSPVTRRGRVGQGIEWFDADRIGVRILLRHWRPGDRFQPIGMRTPVKLQNLFVNQGVERSRRHELTVAEAADGGLFWVEGLRISERYRLDKGTRHLLKWQWRTLCASGEALVASG